MSAIVITIVVAIGSALLQTVMKGISRSNLPNKNHGLKRDDALFWSDWVVAAGLALAGSVVVSANQGKAIPVSQAAFSFFSIVMGCSAFPFFLRVFAYGPNAQMKAWGWKGLGWIVVANSVGILILLGAVVAGVQVYDWS